MKQLLSILLIVTVVYSTVGIRVKEHFCRATNTKQNAIFQKQECCSHAVACCAEKKKTKDCCTDEVTLLHLSQDINLQLEEVQANTIVSVLAEQNTIFLPACYSYTVTPNNKGRAPPLINHQQNVQALLQVYRL